MGWRRGEGLGSSVLSAPFLPSAGAATRSLTLGSPAAGSLRPHRGRRSPGVRPSQAVPPPCLLPRNTHCAPLAAPRALPSEGTYVARGSGLSHATSPKTRLGTCGAGPGALSPSHPHAPSVSGEPPFTKAHLVVCALSAALE
uniref:Uncharacterized protein n=1 Tax=Pipistrellus kuhlii TaxID=59472 RepID=A0A7J7XB72_PIPKU|nr:hypothetical protein mPipKuh1_010639 [Pipistrellus kuhlii]